MRGGGLLSVLMVVMETAEPALVGNVGLVAPRIMVAAPRIMVAAPRIMVAPRATPRPAGLAPRLTTPPPLTPGPVMETDPRPRVAVTPLMAPPLETMLGPPRADVMTRPPRGMTVDPRPPRPVGITAPRPRLEAAVIPPRIGDPLGLVGVVDLVGVVTGVRRIGAALGVGEPIGIL